MPLLYFDVIEGRKSGEIKALLDTAHAATVDAFGVPERDRYQVPFGLGRAQFLTGELH